MGTWMTDFNGPFFADAAILLLGDFITLLQSLCVQKM